uniref:Plastid light harvesting protein n=1 Tax=Leptocylindrus danicus TaxID=163516 RepID=A0A7S2L212_9STRA|mmetsp:Transcript_29601/g.43444  ORF Transcript_29601/g.43444 Transcript_29601/m.43444 type:complete len:205 (+) Transcript_29601:74-688(+)|eukprot:CAMPEP_0116029512 /NCGR_PEP_ID=MMETSP0321-20121206/16184_1 /TAXON_ID=163516 /ORGANISM="Leptocylindrus danicus var. danicus, Strain B650" /LENGTH=204 /DNA_ID=CAMNT_0003503903 /DNA_START=62 /DNA_END=676 /DNA_ORIENTATION=-
MKLTVSACLIGAASAFAPSTGGRASTSLSASEKSQALPFLPAPQNLKGYVGDVGFDPLRISDYFPMDYLREAELKHSRIAMLAWSGFVTVDQGIKIYPFPEAMEGTSSATAHDAAVATGAMGQILLFIGIAEMLSWIGVSQMLQGSGREPGDFGLDPLGFLVGKSEEEVNRMKLRELKNGRLAMMAIGGVATQSVLTGHGFPYV